MQQISKGTPRLVNRVHEHPYQGGVYSEYPPGVGSCILVVTVAVA